MVMLKVLTLQTLSTLSDDQTGSRLKDRVYLGEVAQYQFAADAHSLKIYELNPRFVEAPADRDEQSLAVSAEQQQRPCWTTRYPVWEPDDHWKRQLARGPTDQTAPRLK